MASACVAVALAVGLLVWPVQAHIIPPERLHPAAENYRLLNFLLSLNPILWDQVDAASGAVADQLTALAPTEGQGYRAEVDAAIAELRRADELPGAKERKEAARRVFELSTRAVARTLELRLRAAGENLDDHAAATRHLDEARQIWSAFEHEVKATDSRAFHELGAGWLLLDEALGNRGVLGVGVIAPDEEAYARASSKLINYVRSNFGGNVRMAGRGVIAAVPAHSPTYDPKAVVRPKLPPRSNINKQLPRPRQILNMAARGVDESETVLIALGDMAFDSSFIFGEPARSLAVTCNTCHNKSITNPGFFIPGLSLRPGGMDVSNNYFAPHASNGHFDHIDIPDLRGIRFTAPYGRNGRFDSLREFSRNVIVNEFNGEEPDPILLDALIAYMLEFDFLPNPYLEPAGTLNDKAPESAKRGERIFNRPFEQMAGRSCASCHIPSDNFLDRKRHDIGTVQGAEVDSRDRAMDTPTLLSSRYTQPYFHDGSQPTLRAVNEWFNQTYALRLSTAELDDLTAYVETIGGGVDAYEDTLFTLEAEMEEFKFFLSSYEFLRTRNKPELMTTTFNTIAQEIRAHKWDVQDDRYLPTLDRLAVLMDEAAEALERGDPETADERVAAYRQLYQENVEHLR